MLRLVSLVGGGIVAVALLVSGATAAPGGAAPAVAAEPVPSLTPAATARLWSALVRRPGRHRFATAECQPLRAIFYAATDWRRLVTKLAVTPSPCAHHYVSVPPLVSDKSQPRPDEAWRIRALGPSFHALAEINVTGWTRWVTDNGQSWYEAGREARRRMAAAGYDVAAGDTWALNELSSAVRAGTGNARANMRAFLNGLHDGDGVAARGVVFTAGIGQATTELSVYRARLQDWYEDEGFWADLARVTRDWSQEVYGDVRLYAAAGASREARRDALGEYLHHQVALAGAAPSSVTAARTVLGSAYAPVANAAWRYDAAFGWTDVAVELMQDYVSAQTYALRSAGLGGFGFAWSPKNLAAVPPADFNAHTDALLERLAAAIDDSSEDAAGACGTEWCTGELAGAALTPSWRAFAAWSPSRLTFTSPPQTLAPGAVSTPLTIELQTSTGVPYTAGLPVPVELASSSATAELSTSLSGPWAPTVSATIPSGAGAVDVYVRDATSGSSTLTASSTGRTAGTHPLVVAPPEPPPPPPPPAGGGGGALPPDVGVTVAAAKTSLVPNEVVEVTVTVATKEIAAATGLRAAITLPPDAVLLAPPGFERGTGCTGASTLDCNLDYLPAGTATQLRFSLNVGSAGSKTIHARVSASNGEHDGRDNGSALTLEVSVPPAATRTPTSREGVTRTGTNGPNVLSGTAGADVLNGRGGNDRLAGRAGNDRLFGGAGADRLFGGPGRDVLDGGRGNDTIAAADRTKDRIRCGTGRDVVVADRADVVARDCEVVRRRR